MYNELRHHGILGQKWGIRRYQNKDGSLTEEGRKRYSSLPEEHKTDILKNMARNIESSNEYKQFVSDLDERDKQYDNNIIKFNKIGNEYDSLPKDQKKFYDDVYMYMHGDFDKKDALYKSRIEKFINDKGIENNTKKMNVESFEYYQGGKGMYVYAKEPSIINALNNAIKYDSTNYDRVRTIVDRKIESYFGSEYINKLQTPQYTLLEKALSKCNIPFRHTPTTMERKNNRELSLTRHEIMKNLRRGW